MNAEWMERLIFCIDSTLFLRLDLFSYAKLVAVLNKKMCQTLRCVFVNSSLLATQVLCQHLFIPEQGPPFEQATTLLLRVA